MMGIDVTGRQWKFAVLLMAALLALATAACSHQDDPLFCCTTVGSCTAGGENRPITPCTDPDRPYCDDEGPEGTGLFGHGRTCIAQPEGTPCRDAEACPGETPVCLEHICVQCEDESQCTGDAEPLCNQATHTCVACVGDEDCDAATPVCSANECVECAMAEDCDASRPICAGSQCIECVDAKDCGGGTPVCVAGDCVQCAMAEDCSEAAPICDDNACRGCIADAECASNVCDEEGSACLDEAAVIYVATAGIPGGTCTRDAPCNSFAQALTQVTGTRNVIKASPGMYEEALAISGIEVIILGDGATVQPAVENQSAVAVSGGAEVTIEGMTVTGARGPEEPVGVACSGASSLLRLRRSTVIGNTGGGGISISGCEFSLVNNIIARNGSLNSPFGGLFISQIVSSGLHEFSFNTVTDNGGATNVVTGVDCASVAAPLTFSNNIVYLNRVLGTGTQVDDDDGCSWRYSDIGPQTVAGTGNINQDPQFIDPDAEVPDFHIQPESPARDAADPAATTARDIDGDRRPAGGRSDMGADEVPE